MINTLMTGIATFVLLGIGIDPNLVLSSSTPKCVTSIDVSSSVTSGGRITVTVTPDRGSACTSSTCNFTAASTTQSVSLTYDTNSDQFDYLDATGTSSAPQVGEPSTTIAPTGSGASVDFGVIAAYYNGTENKLAWEPDPVIIVTTGACNG